VLGSKTKNFYMLKIFSFIVVLIFGMPKKIEKFIKGEVINTVLLS